MSSLVISCMGFRNSLLFRIASVNYYSFPKFSLKFFLNLVLYCDGDFSVDSFFATFHLEILLSWILFAFVSRMGIINNNNSIIILRLSQSHLRAFIEEVKYTRRSSHLPRQQATLLSVFSFLCYLYILWKGYKRWITNAHLLPTKNINLF